MKSTQLLTTLILSGAALSKPITETTNPSPSLLARATTNFRANLRALRALVPRIAPYDTNSDELTAEGSVCKAVTMIYARGTTQDGNIGAAGDVGPDTMDALSAILGTENLAVQGVPYDADIVGFLGNLVGFDDDGVKTMADLVVRASTQCPDTKIVMSGYSQGGQIVHEAANTLVDDGQQAALDKVAAVLVYGDPENGNPVGNIPAEKIKIICNEGDNICEGGILVLPPHSTYQLRAGEGADFVAGLVQ